MYKAFALDLDGTLLVGEELPEVNIQAIGRARDTGIHIMIATARWAQHAQRIAQALGTQGLLIACSGAQVRDSVTGTDIFDHRLPEKFTQELFDICNSDRCIATVTFDNNVLLKLEGEPDSSQMPSEMSWVPQLRVNNANLPRIAAIQGSGVIRRIRNELQQKYADSVNIFDSIGPNGKIIITITAKQGTKGRALASACTHLGITAADVVAFGDAENDLDMFRVAGAAVAMGQADTMTKAAATFVSLPNDQGGVAHAIHHLLDHGNF
jgi:Cof subfamily protein (haloacid dehalogenase superfamily)